MHTVLKTLVLFSSFISSTAFATEFTDGLGGRITVRNDMHACPRGGVVTGVHVDSNLLLCEEHPSFSLAGAPGVAQETTDFGVTRTNQFPYTNGRTLHWCGPNAMVTGVHVDRNGFSCARWVSRDGTVLPSGTPFLDGAPGVSAVTVRSAMHACPVGTVLVGAFFAENAFLCAARNYCTTDGAIGCGGGQRCVIDVPPGREISSLLGVCTPLAR
jgi:hypothetical protein